VDGRNGLLVERDPVAVAGALSRVLRQPLWAQLHDAALVDVQSWSWPAATKTLVGIFGQVARSRDKADATE
jgi:hypothetical protein